MDNTIILPNKHIVDLLDCRPEYGLFLCRDDVTYDDVIYVVYQTEGSSYNIFRTLYDAKDFFIGCIVGYRLTTEEK